MTSAAPNAANSSPPAHLAVEGCAPTARAAWTALFQSPAALDALYTAPSAHCTRDGFEPLIAVVMFSATFTEATSCPFANRCRVCRSVEPFENVRFSYIRPM